MKRMKSSDDAVVGIVATFLIVGLIVTVISMIQAVYIPKWMEQTEADHMEVVADQFSQLKFAIDTQSAIQKPGTPISTSITLGNKELPFLTSSRAYGSLDILSDECMLTINDSTVTKSYPLGVIKYFSANAYFLNQAYICEAGAVILSQSQGNTMSIKPAFSVSYGVDINISFTIINISTIGEKRSIGGYGTYPIQTEFSEVDFTNFTDVKDITIDTNYQKAWQKFINNTLINSGLNYHGYDTNFSININGDSVILEFNSSITVNLKLKRVTINAQIAPGWIIDVKGVSKNL
jgi:hypothetical protein